MASSPAAKARTELNVAIGYLDRAARRLAGEPGYLRQAHTLERLSGELADVLATHRRQIVAFHAAGLADRVRWGRPGLATDPVPSMRGGEAS
jgi:hypothetical protein